MTAENDKLEPVKDTEPEREVLDTADVVIGYYVGLNKDGSLTFRVVGDDRGIVQLLGIHDYAERKVRALFDDSQLVGDRITHEVGKAVQGLHQKVDELISRFVKPQNKI